MKHVCIILLDKNGKTSEISKSRDKRGEVSIFALCLQSEGNETTDKSRESEAPALLELRRTIARTQTHLMSLLKALDSDVSSGAKSGLPIIDDK
jgi:hypothetical protein